MPQSHTNRINSTGASQKRPQAESPTGRYDHSDVSYSPRRANLNPANHYTKFTTTVMGPFRTKGGYSAPEQKKRDLAIKDISQGPFFNSRVTTAVNSIEKRGSPYSLKNKAQLPNVSKQRVQVKSLNDRQYKGPAPIYPNALAGPNVGGRSSNNSSRHTEAAKQPNTSFQIMNNFIQTSYGGMGSINQTQVMNKTGYGALIHDSKIGGTQTNTSRANKKYKITNFYPTTTPVAAGNTLYLRKHNKNLFNIYKAKQQNRGEIRNRSPSSPRGKSNSPTIPQPTTQLFGKQFGQSVPRAPATQHRKIVINNSGRANYSPRAMTDMQYTGIMNNTMTGGFMNNSFNITGMNNLSNVNKNSIFKNQRF